MEVKNITLENIPINKSVQIDINTPDVNDGYVLPDQTLDLSLSLSLNDILRDTTIKDNIFNGGLVFVVDNIELDTATSIEIYEAGPAQWAKVFNPVVSQNNLYEGLALGFLYVKNCLIG